MEPVPASPLGRPRVPDRRALRLLLAGWQEKYPTVPVTVHVIVGHPYRVLADAASG